MMAMVMMTMMIMIVMMMMMNRPLLSDDLKMTIFVVLKMKDILSKILIDIKALMTLLPPGSMWRRKRKRLGMLSWTQLHRDFTGGNLKYFYPQFFFGKSQDIHNNIVYPRRQRKARMSKYLGIVADGANEL